MGRQLVSYFLITFIFLSSSCRKRDVIPAPILRLEYNSALSNYSGYTQYDFSSSSFQLQPSTSVTFSISPLGDSIELSFLSQLKDKTGLPSTIVIVSKRFARNQCDSTTTGWVLKNDDDFSNVFEQSNIESRYFDGSSMRDGLYLALSLSGANYELPLTYNSHIDTTNQFVIAEVVFDTPEEQKVDWSKLISDGIVPSSPCRKAMVRFNFRCKLFDGLNDSTVFDNGVYQGVFVDR